MRAIRFAPAVLLAVGCGNREEEGPLPDVQRAGEIALETGSAKKFLELYPGSTPEGSPDECENRIGRGERCGDARHVDVTLTQPEGETEAAVLLVEIGPRGKVLHIAPNPAFLSDPARCDDDEDCACARCTGCVNRIQLPAKRAAEGAGCEENRCKTYGCRCSGERCVTR